MSNPTIGALAFPPAYPGSKPNTWPPPSGGAPITAPELGPILNPFPYGTTQGSNINTAPPSPPSGYPPPFGGQPGTFYPKKTTAANIGQNQGPGYQLPARTRPLEIGPIKADPTTSAIKPAPIMGPGSTGT